MVKKKGINKLYLVGGAGGAVAAVLVAVFVFGVGLDFVNPQFQEPTDLTVQEIQQNEQVIIDVENIFCGGGTTQIGIEDIPSDTPLEIQQILLSTEVFCIPLKEEIIPDGVDEETKKLEDEIIDPVPITDPIINQTMTNQTKTIFSEDSVIGQICDELNLDCGSTTFVLSSKVTKIDSAGEVEVVEGRFGFEQLALFVEDVSDKDYSTGRLIIELKIEGDPNTPISGKTDTLGRTGQAQLGLLIPTNEFPSLILPDLELQVADTTDANGEAVVFFIGPTGALSPNFIFEFANFINDFPNEVITPLALHLDFFNISDGTNDFSIRNLELFSMDIARDDQKILITNEEGITERVYPSDSRILITTKTNEIKGTQCLIYKSETTVVFDSALGRNQITGSVQTGCKAVNLSCPCLGTDPPTNKLDNVIAGTATSPTLSGINLLDSEGRLVATALGGIGTVFDELVTRNANYTIQVISPPISADLSFGKSQETQSFTCEATPLPIQKITSTVVTRQLNPGVGGFTSGTYTNYYYYITTDGVRPTTESNTQCNFP